MSVKTYFMSMGCAKNLTDTERMIAMLEEQGIESVSSAELADVAVINTCGFIEDAQQESINAILELAELKKQGSLKGIVAAGCLTERFKEQFSEALPEVDGILGTGSYGNIGEAVKAAAAGNRYSSFEDFNKVELGGRRKLLTPSYSAYIKIAEGCFNRCSYCVIPLLRGSYHSRPMDELIEEARELAAQGCRELIVIAQDVSRYGIDLYKENRLPDLINAFCEIDGIEWIRLHYLYPDGITERLLTTIASQPKVLKYFDIPFQHVNSRILKLMNRKGREKDIRELLQHIREMMPEAVIRTSLISGFPGETEEEHGHLADFLAECRLERCGIFAYSREDGTPAAELPDQIDQDVKERRRAELYGIQQNIMDDFAETKVGQILDVLACGCDEDGRYWGRSYMDSPDIDCVVYFDKEVTEGNIYKVRITGTIGCDLESALL